jgi:hypothetical protein
MNNIDKKSGNCRNFYLQKRQCGIVTVLTLFFTCFGAVLFPQEIPSGKISKEYLETLFQKVFANRDQIKSGQMEIVNTIARMDGERVQSRITHEMKLAFDEKRRRVDRHNILSPKSSYDDVGCLGCYNNPNLVLQYSNYCGKDTDNLEIVSSHTLCTFFDTVQLKENKLTKFWTDDFGFVPQYIACFSRARLPTEEGLKRAKEIFFTNTIGLLEPSDVAVVREEYKGTPCLKISFQFTYSGVLPEESSSVTVLIAEGQGYSIRKYHLVSVGGLFPQEDLLEVDVQQDRVSGIWFPSAWLYEWKKEGKLRTRQNGIIKNVVLNQSIPDRLFDMKTISILPPGVRIIWHATTVPPPFEGKLFWDGKNIVSSKNYGWQQIEENRKQSRLKNFLLINASFLCLILAVFFLRYYRRLKQQIPDEKTGEEEK